MEGLGGEGQVMGGAVLLTFGAQGLVHLGDTPPPPPRRGLSWVLPHHSHPGGYWRVEVCPHRNEEMVVGRCGVSPPRLGDQDPPRPEWGGPGWAPGVADQVLGGTQ